MIDHARLLELLHYCPVTGVFTRKVALSNNSKVGETAGNLCNGYVELSVDGRVYRAHRLAWFYAYGVWPSGKLDHWDLNKTNNAIGNLRDATQSQNGGNNRMRKHNSLGFKGVTRHGDKFKAAVMINRKRIHLGVFETPEQAAEVYDTAAIQHFGKFALTNKDLGLMQ